MMNKTDTLLEMAKYLKGNGFLPEKQKTMLVENVNQFNTKQDDDASAKLSVLIVQGSNFIKENYEAIYLKEVEKRLDKSIFESDEARKYILHRLPNIDVGVNNTWETIRESIDKEAYKVSTILNKYFSKFNEGEEVNLIEQLDSLFGTKESILEADMTDEIEDDPEDEDSDKTSDKDKDKDAEGETFEDTIDAISQDLLSDVKEKPIIDADVSEDNEKKGVSFVINGDNANIVVENDELEETVTSGDVFQNPGMAFHGMYDEKQKEEDDKDKKKKKKSTGRKKSSKKSNKLMTKKGLTEGMDTHVWEGWTVGAFIKELQPMFDIIMKGKSWMNPFQTKDEIKKWCKDTQPYYKKHIPEVVNYFVKRAKQFNPEFGRK